MVPRRDHVAVHSARPHTRRPDPQGAIRTAFEDRSASAAEPGSAHVQRELLVQQVDHLLVRSQLHLPVGSAPGDAAHARPPARAGVGKDDDNVGVHPAGECPAHHGGVVAGGPLGLGGGVELDDQVVPRRQHQGEGALQYRRLGRHEDAA